MKLAFLFTYSNGFFEFRFGLVQHPFCQLGFGQLLNNSFEIGDPITQQLFFVTPTLFTHINPFSEFDIKSMKLRTGVRIHAHPFRQKDLHDDKQRKLPRRYRANPPPLRIDTLFHCILGSSTPAPT